MGFVCLVDIVFQAFGNVMYIDICGVGDSVLVVDGLVESFICCGECRVLWGECFQCLCDVLCYLVVDVEHDYCSFLLRCLRLIISHIVFLISIPL